MRVHKAPLKAFALLLRLMRYTMPLMLFKRGGRSFGDLQAAVCIMAEVFLLDIAAAEMPQQQSKRRASFMIIVLTPTGNRPCAGCHV